MRIERVKLHNFRNLREIAVDVSPRINILLGRNGQGKTNFLEALSYLALGRSFRTSRDRELIQFQQDFSHVSVEGRDAQDEPFLLEAALTRDGKKKIKVVAEQPPEPEKPKPKKKGKAKKCEPKVVGKSLPKR